MIRKSVRITSERRSTAKPTCCDHNLSNVLTTGSGFLLTSPPIFSIPPLIPLPANQIVNVKKPCEPMSLVSNATNSKSPEDLKSRIFIGNLNTSVVSKRQLHKLFSLHGPIRAMSVHKGYAFIQYRDEIDALNACMAQDGCIIAGQTIGMLFCCPEIVLTRIFIPFVPSDRCKPGD